MHAPRATALFAANGAVRGPCGRSGQESLSGGKRWDGEAPLARGEGANEPSSLSQLRDPLASKMAGMQIEPAWLEEGKDTATCNLCLMVLEQPTSGCPDAHALCKKCYDTWLIQKKQCPTCRHPTKTSKFVPSREPQSLRAVTMPPSVP